MDRIVVSGSPGSWRIKSIVQDLLRGLRRSKLVPSGASVVLAVSCVDSREIRRLNKEFRGKDKPTDILSFEQPPSAAPKGVVFLGDLVLCREYVEKGARDHRHGVRSEAAVLLAHGLLHLLGFDHERSRNEALRMARAEARLLDSTQKNLNGLVGRTQVKDRHE